MAIQAQCPCNLLLLNGREQGQDFLLQSSQPAGLVHQSVVNNEGGVNPRKRERGAVDFETEHYPFQTFGNLTQQSAVSIGLGLSSESQQQRQKKQHLGLLLGSSVAPFLSDDLSAQIKHQNDEINQLLQTQEEQLRHALAQRQRAHYLELVGKAEELALRRLSEKNAEIREAVRRNAELQQRAALLKTEAQVWEAKAMQQAAAAAMLQSQLLEAAMAAPAHDKDDDAGPAEDAESACVDPRRSMSGVPVCRACRKTPVSVVFLPCRHLCVCAACDLDVQCCPVCLCVRTASVEVYL